MVATEACAEETWIKSLETRNAQPSQRNMNRIFPDTRVPAFGEFCNCYIFDIVILGKFFIIPLSMLNISKQWWL